MHAKVVLFFLAASWLMDLQASARRALEDSRAASDADIARLKELTRSADSALSRQEDEMRHRRDGQQRRLEAKLEEKRRRAEELKARLSLAPAATANLPGMPMMAETFPPGAPGTLPGTLPGGTMPGTIPSLTGANEQRRSSSSA